MPFVTHAHHGGQGLAISLKVEEISYRVEEISG